MNGKTNEWLFNWETLSERFEEEFEGVIIDARLPCDCALCVKGKEKLGELGRLRKDSAQMHIVIAPLDESRPLRHVFIDMSAKVRFSRRGVWALALKWLNITVRDMDEFMSKLSKKIFVFKRTSVEDALMHYGVKVPQNLKKGDALKNALEADIIFPVSMILENEYPVKGIDRNKLVEYIEKRKKEWEDIKEGRVKDHETENEVQFI